MFVDPAVLYAQPAQRRCLEVAEEIVTHIRQQPATPRRTGALVSGYRAVRAAKGADVVTNVEYWHFVEFGTSVMDAEPHVRPAIEWVRRRHLR